jgi:Beta propeller domain
MHFSRLGKLFALAALGALTSALPGCHKTTAGPASIVQHASRKTLTAFGSEAELGKFLSDLAASQKRVQRESAEEGSMPGYASADAPAPPAQAPAPEATAAPSETKAADGESVTNTQHAGVDEGGIVKLHGDQLVVLRRGRLFSVSISDLSLVSMVDAFGPDIDPNGTWYDEMLLSKDTIAVIGYSYERGGTEIGLFDITGAGKISYRATYHLRSNDYYSSRNYASRLIGDKLIFYSPLYLSLSEDDPFQSFPALRKWHKGVKNDEWRRIVAAPRVYRPILASTDLTLHTVTVCDLGKRELSCEATAVLGPPGRVFYVSPSSVFVWMTEWQSEANKARSIVYRLPLDGSGPSALRVSGTPVDQFSFLESPDGHLNVLVRADAGGDAMWNAEASEGAVALMRVPLETFSDGADRVPSSLYRALPTPQGSTFQNRFVGAYVLYGTGNGWGAPEENARGGVYAYPYAGGQPTSVRLGHVVDRIEALGNDALVVGSDGKDLHFTPLALGVRPNAATTYTRKNASQGELRSHGFFYKPEDDHSGLLGLPIRQEGRPGYEHLFSESAAVLFLKNDLLKLGELGTLAAHPEGSSDDACRASCVDWYGNARPLFLRGKIYALLGYEIVEGDVGDGRIHETRRSNFSPRIPKIAR